MDKDAGQDPHFPDAVCELFCRLLAPFGSAEIKSRPGKNGQTYRYVRKEAVENRLDSVLGPHNWSDEYLIVRRANVDDAVICKLSLRVNGQWIAKSGLAGFRAMDDASNSVKSGGTGAFIAAAEKWGIGRYIRRQGAPDFVADLTPPEFLPYEEDTRQNASGRPGEPHEARGASRRDDSRERRGGSAGAAPGVPQTGKALFAWIKRMESERGAKALLSDINTYGQNSGWAERMIVWSREQVAEAYQWAVDHALN